MMRRLYALERYIQASTPICLGVGLRSLRVGEEETPTAFAKVHKLIPKVQSRQKYQSHGGDIRVDGTLSG